MRITAKLFALMREKAGTDTVQLELPENSSIAQALVALQRQHPVLQPYLATARVAVQMEFVEAETILHAGEEFALIPPVSGGA